MACRVGITTDPERRRQEWESKANVQNWQIVGQGLTRQQAQNRENEIARQQGCEASPGGNDPDNGSASWYVYRFDF